LARPSQSAVSVHSTAPHKFVRDATSPHYRSPRPARYARPAHERSRCPPMAHRSGTRLARRAHCRFADGAGGRGEPVTYSQVFLDTCTHRLTRSQADNPLLAPPALPKQQAGHYPLAAIVARPALPPTSALPPHTRRTPALAAGARQVVTFDCILAASIAAHNAGIGRGCYATRAVPPTQFTFIVMRA